MSTTSLWELITHPYVFVLIFDAVLGLITGYLIAKLTGRFLFR